MGNLENHEIKITRPKYSRNDNKSIDLIIEYSDTGLIIPITVSDDDPETLDLYNRSINLEFGEIEPYRIEDFLSLKEAIKEKIIAIKAHRDTLTADYIIIDGHHFHSDTSSRIQQLSLTKMGQAKQVPPGLMWQTKNHGLIELTNEIAAQFETVTLEHDMRLFANAQRHIAAVEALEDIQAVLDYDYTPGWQP